MTAHSCIRASDKEARRAAIACAEPPPPGIACAISPYPDAASRASSASRAS